MSNRKTPELDMVLDCYAFFKNTVGFQYAALEVPFLSRCIDMALVNENGVIFTIEFKINDIRHAITQAKDHALGADYAFICIPENKKVDMELLRNENIGLYLYNPSAANKAKTAYMPALNKRKVRLFSGMLLKNIMKIATQECHSNKEQQKAVLGNYGKLNEPVQPGSAADQMQKQTQARQQQQTAGGFYQ